MTAILLVVGAILCSIGVARAAAVPSFQLGQTQCVAGGQLKVFPPRSMSPVERVDYRNAERVQWSPDLQVWNGRGWANFDTRRPFYTAFTTSYGYFQTTYGAVWQSPQNMQVMWVPFTALPAGTYRVRNRLYWAKLGRTYYADSGQTCRFV
jgi:hypothetical protein